MQSRKLAAILFADIVGYTAFMQRNEEEGLRKVERFREVLEEKVIEHQGDILQYYGDGCLVIFSSGILALECAKEIQETLNDKYSLKRGQVEVPLRIGIHIGDIVIKNEAIFGDGVNLASRIESLGVAGAVLFSERLIADLNSHPQFRFVSLGQFHFKNVDKPMEVFALANKGFPVPKRSEMRGKLKNEPSKKELPKWRSLLLSFLSKVGNPKAQKDETLDANANSSKIALPSIAVLPFEDLSPQKDQEYFADGIAEEILNTLSQLGELKVVGRTSSFSFKGKKATIAEIGKALKVNHLLEGSIRKHGEKIRITAQLIKVTDGFHLWSKKYDEDFTDIFKIQDTVAQDIGQVLLKKIAPEQLSKLKNTTHQNSEVYEVFLRAKHILTRFLAAFSPDDFKKTEELFLEALELDPHYALAHAGLADLYDTYLVWRVSRRDAKVFKKYDALRIKESNLAYQIDPTHVYVNEIKSRVMLNTQAKLENVYESFLKTYQLNPNKPDALIGLANVYLRKGLVYDAIQFADKALVIDPLHTWAYAWKIYALGIIGNFELAIQEAKIALEINSNEVIILANLASFFVFSQNKEAAMATYEKISRINSDYLERDPYFQVKLNALKDPSKLPETIHHQPSIALLPIGNVEIDYLSGDKERFERSFLAWWDRWEKGAYTSEFNFFSSKNGSTYLHLKNHLIYQGFRGQPWFEEILRKEKEKFDDNFKRFIRPEELFDNLNIV